MASEKRRARCAGQGSIPPRQIWTEAQDEKMCNDPVLFAHVFTAVTASSGPDGRFQVDVSAHIRRFKKVQKTGYRHFYELRAGGSNVDNTFFSISAWGDLDYKTAVDHPAIYLFVKDGVKEVSALPCRGGYSFNGKQWTPNQPAWPKKPSLSDVVYKAASTKPTTQP